MKSTKINQFLISGLIFFSQQAFGQAGGIDSLKITPQNALATDEIKVICYSTFSHGGCGLVTHSVTFQGNQITLNLEYEIGFLTYICNSVDTISLGNLAAGDYQLHANLMVQPMEEIVDTDTASFSIDNPLSLEDETHPENLEVYPNPFNQEVQIKTTAVIEEIEISAISGQNVVLKQTLNALDKTIDLSDLKPGIYLLTALDSNGNKYTKRIVKNTL